MSKDIIAVVLVIMLLAGLFAPFPTRVAKNTKAQFVFADGRPVPGLKVTQGWECYGLFGGGRAEATTDASGFVDFPSRAAYGTVATRIFGRLLTFVAAHSSYGASVRLDFFIEDPFRAVFTPPLYKPLEPFSTSGTYLDSTGRYYFPQESKGWQSVSVTGDFMHNAKNIKIILASKQAINSLQPMPVGRPRSAFATDITHPAWLSSSR